MSKEDDWVLPGVILAIIICLVVFAIIGTYEYSNRPTRCTDSECRP